MAEQLKDLAQFNGYKQLPLALSKLSDLLHQVKLRSPKLQTRITDFFSHHVECKTLLMWFTTKVIAFQTMLVLYKRELPCVTVVVNRYNILYTCYSSIFTIFYTTFWETSIKRSVGSFPRMTP